MDLFNSMVTQLLAHKPMHTRKLVSKKEYDIFLKEFLFYKLKGISLGEAFCERFEINEWMLLNLPDSLAKNLIEALGYLEDET